MNGPGIDGGTLGLALALMLMLEGALYVFLPGQVKDMLRELSEEQMRRIGMAAVLIGAVLFYVLAFAA